MYMWLAFLAFLGFCPGSESNSYNDPHCDGRQVIVHLFEWKWTDIAEECERYLGPKGFCGVQVSPPNENAVIMSQSRPWWERYQPVSYKLNTRSGDEAEFKDMVDRCKAVGVKIYVDAVINHMAGSDRSGVGTAGTQFNGGSSYFPGVPFSSNNFHSYSDCGSGGGINYQNSRQVRNCDLVGLKDLDHSQSYVQDKIAGYLNKLVDLGVAGFRVDAAKHMWPGDLSAIQRKVKNLPEGGKPFFYLEVIDFNSEAVKDHEYFQSGYITEFRYEQKVKEGLNDLNRLRYVQDSGWSMVPSNQAMVFVDNHDTQRQSGKLNYKRGAEYKRAVAFTLANDYGLVKVMSSFSFRGNDEGPPHKSDYSIKSVKIKPDGTCDNGWVCEHRWNMVGNLARFRTAVHGQRVTNWYYSNRVLSFSRGNKGFFAMGFGHFTVTRNTGLPAGEYCDLISDCATTVTVDSSGRATIHPADSSEPFVAITTEEKKNSHKKASKSPKKEEKPIKVHSSVHAPAPSTAEQLKKEVAKVVKEKPVNPPNPVQSSIPAQSPKPIETPKPIEAPKPVHPPKPKVTEQKPDHESKKSKPKSERKGKEKATNFQRTVIVIDKETRFGQNIFIRGGLDSSIRSGCTKDVATSPCSIPIRHVKKYSGTHYLTLNSWRKGDNFLDWIGAEPNQGQFRGQKARGTPAFWSTDDSGHEGFSKFNKWGDHQWVVDIEMDCNKTEDGYFQVRASVDGILESRLKHSVGPCKGNGAPASAPFDSKYHIARCGYLNKFSFGEEQCQISQLG